jgi:hypothetical protein
MATAGKLSVRGGGYPKRRAPLHFGEAEPSTRTPRTKQGPEALVQHQEKAPRTLEAGGFQQAGQKARAFKSQALFRPRGSPRGSIDWPRSLTGQTIQQHKLLHGIE